MAIPTFQAVMRPLLELAASGNEIRSSEAVDALAGHFGLSQDEREELVPSGQQRRFYNRVTWAFTYLRATGLLESAGHGRYKVTDRGRQAVASGHSIDLKYLAQFPELAAFRAGTAGVKRPEKEILAEATTSTPDEVLESIYNALRLQLEVDLLDKIRTLDPYLFEKVVLDLLVAMGYGGSREDAGRRTQRSGDEGIDGVINEDPLGLDVVCIQAKRWTTKSVGRPDVQMFSGSLDGKGAKGVFMTTSDFTVEAKEYAAKLTGKKIILINGEQLARLMIQHNVGVASAATYVTKRIDTDYFEVE
jgi:restriction system protein